jgi:hypothetical protein
MQPKKFLGIKMGFLYWDKYPAKSLFTYNFLNFFLKFLGDLIPGLQAKNKNFSPLIAVPIFHEILSTNSKCVFWDIYAGPKTTLLGLKNFRGAFGT